MPSIVYFLTKEVINKRKIVFLGVFLLFLFSLYSLKNLKTSTSFEEFFYKTDPAIKFNDKIKELFGDYERVFVIIDFSRKNVEDNEVPLELAEKKLVEFSKSFYSLPFVKESRFVGFSKDLSKGIISVSFSPSEEEQEYFRKIKALEEFANKNKPFGSLSFTGIGILRNEIGKMIFRDLTITSILSIILITFLILFFFRKVYFLISTIPIIVSVTFLLALFPFLGLNLNFGNILVVTMLFGLGVDYAIHLINEISKEGFENIPKAVENIFPPVFGGFITTVVGFLALFIADIKVIHDLSLLLAFGISLVFFFTFLLIPPLVFSIYNKKEVIKNEIF